MPLGIFIRGCFLGVNQRMKNGEPDGFDVGVSVGADAYKIKFDRVPDGLSFGDPVVCGVKVLAFRDRYYFNGISIELDHE